MSGELACLCSAAEREAGRCKIQCPPSWIPVTSPARGGPDTAGMRSELAEALRGHRWQQVADLFRCSCGYVPDDTPSIEDHRADVLLPVVQRLAVGKAAEALRAAAEDWEALVRREKPPIRGSIWLRARADALAAAAQPGDGRTGE